MGRNEGSLSNQERKGDLSAFMRTIITQMGLKSQALYEVSALFLLIKIGEIWIVIQRLF